MSLVMKASGVRAITRLIPPPRSIGLPSPYIVGATLAVALWACFVILSAAKDLFVRRARPFAALRVTLLERCPGCHPERSEGSLCSASQTFRCTQGDSRSLQMTGLYRE